MIARYACQPDILILSGTFPTFQLIGETLSKPQLEILSGPWHIRIAHMQTSMCTRLVICSAMFVVFAIAILAQDVAYKSDPLPPGKLIDVGGYRVHLYCIGAGSPAVIIVGAGFSFDGGWSSRKQRSLRRYVPITIRESDASPRDCNCLAVLAVIKAITVEARDIVLKDEKEMFALALALLR